MSISPLIMKKIERASQDFVPISLAEMDNVKLMDRTDVKYLFSVGLLPDILARLQIDYMILEINKVRICGYETQYYDESPKLTLYTKHHAGFANRYKVRTRNYVGSDLQFFEVKFKNNQGRTHKTRIKTQNSGSQLINGKEADFLRTKSNLIPQDLQGVLWVYYKRITLVSRHTPERLTIDLELGFKNESAQKDYPQIVIAEVKQDKVKHSPFIELMKEMGIRQGSISKYCFGIISLFEGVKQNHFKPHLLKLSKIINQYDSFTRNI
jgi:VTC domain